MSISTARKGWIFRWDGSTAQLSKIKAQSLRGSIWIIFWGPNGGARILPTRKRCEEVQKVWERWKQRQGKRTWGFSGATWACETQPGEWKDRDVFVIHKFDPETLLPQDDGILNYFRVEA